MTEVEKKSEIEEVKEEPKKALYLPEINMFNNKESTGYIIEIMLPGVEKDTIKLKMNKDNIVVYGESDTTKYGGVYELCCPVDTSEAKSTYKNGLLKIEVPYLDMLKDAVN
ncbi:MAG: Hsp20/alpha crystallin family protein, partial [Candidatus Thorarchaeota archaeon]